MGQSSHRTNTPIQKCPLRLCWQPTLLCDHPKLQESYTSLSHIILLPPELGAQNPHSVLQLVWGQTASTWMGTTALGWLLQGLLEEPAPSGINSAMVLSPPRLSPLTPNLSPQDERQTSTLACKIKGKAWLRRQNWLTESLLALRREVSPNEMPRKAPHEEPLPFTRK